VARLNHQPFTLPTVGLINKIFKKQKTRQQCF